MTLLIALIANGIFNEMTGQPFIPTAWIFVVWIVHLYWWSN